MEEISSIIWFVYDGDCPICNIAAQGWRIRVAVGNIQLVNAREAGNHPIMLEIKENQLSLDAGMVIKYQNRFYQGV